MICRSIILPRRRRSAVDRSDANTNRGLVDASVPELQRNPALLPERGEEPLGEFEDRRCDAQVRHVAEGRQLLGDRCDDLRVRVAER